MALGIKQTMAVFFSNFKTTKCKGCPVREKCTKAKQNGKIVQRRQYAPNIEANRLRIENDKSTYKKRQWGFSYIITKKYIHRARADVALMMTAYNLRRIINILGKDLLQKYFQMVLNTLFYIFEIIRPQMGLSEPLKIFVGNKVLRNKNGCNELKLSHFFAYFRFLDKLTLAVMHKLK